MKKLFSAFSIALLLYSCTNNSNKSELKPQTSVPPDSCKWVVYNYRSGHKSCEGLSCNDLRQGVWKDWYTDGTLRDSGMFNKGCYVYQTDSLQHLKGTINFKGNPTHFYKDSIYFFSASLNQPFNHTDVEPYYENWGTRDGKKYLLQHDSAPEDSFLNIIKFIKKGKVNVTLCLHDWNTDSLGIDHMYPFYEKDIEVLEK